LRFTHRFPRLSTINIDHHSSSVTHDFVPLPSAYCHEIFSYPFFSREPPSEPEASSVQQVIRAAKVQRTPAFCDCGLPRTSTNALRFETVKKKGKITSRGGDVAAIIEGEIMKLSIELKVAIVVAAGFVALTIGAMA
jgi:hypothetical protein